MEIIISSCKNCPFRYSDIDYDMIGNDTIEICTLSQYLGKSSFFIDCHDSTKKQKHKFQTPEWCPLKNNTLSINYEKRKDKKL